MGSLTRGDWNTVLTDVNTAVTNPPEGVICTPLDPLPLVGPNHIWSRQDVLDVYDKLRQMYCSEAFVPGVAPTMWNQSIIDIIYNSLASAWCDCPTFQATYIYHTLPLRPYACGDQVLGGDSRAGYFPPDGNTFKLFDKVGYSKVLCPSSGQRRWRAYSSITGDGKSRISPTGNYFPGGSVYGNYAWATGPIDNIGRVGYYGDPYTYSLQGPTWRNTLFPQWWISACNSSYTYNCEAGYQYCNDTRDNVVSNINDVKAAGRDRWEFTLRFEIYQGGEWLPINTLADAECDT